MLRHIISFASGAIIALLSQVLIQPWMEYRRARARLLKVFLVNHKGWDLGRMNADNWRVFMAEAPKAAEDLLTSQLAMPARLRGPREFQDVVDRVKYAVSKSPDQREEQRARLCEILLKLGERDLGQYGLAMDGLRPAAQE